MQYDIKANWSGSYPNLCSGIWTIAVNGITLGGLGDSHMETLGSYQSWHFEDWIEVFESYEDGMDFNEWKGNLPNNLGMSLRLAGFNPKDNTLLESLYDAVCSEDWRSSSCGGCI